jgi:hypothetical protein
MSCNSAIYTANTTPQELLGNAQIPFGAIVRRFGRFANLDGFGITLCAPGYYKCDCSATLTPAASGNLSVQLYVNGEPYPGAVATGYGTTGNPVNLAFPAIVRLKGCADSSATLAVRIGESGATVSNMAFSVEKI